MIADRRIFLWVALLLVVGLTRSLQMDILLNAGYVYLNHAYTGNSSQRNTAQTIFRSIVDRNGYNEEARWGLGQILMLSALDEAINVWRGSSLAVERLLAYAHFAEKKGDWSEAQTYYQILKQIDPQNSDHWYNYGRMAQRLRNWEDALANYERALIFNSFATPRQSDVYYQRGVVYQWGPDGIKDLSLALQNYEQALQLNQFSAQTFEAESWYKIGEISGWQGVDAAILADLFAKTLAIEPGHNWARLRYGYALYWSTGEVAPAEVEIKRVISAWERSQNPALKWGYRYLGDIYMDQQDWEKAKLSYLRVLELDPTDQYVQAKIGQLNER